MPIRVEIEGVGVAEFPDGTPDDVIDSSVKREIAASRKPATGVFESVLGQLGGLGGPAQVAPMPSPRTQPSEFEAYKAGVSETVAGTARYGVPTVAGLATGGASVPVQAGVGAAAGAGSDLFAQLMEVAGGTREEVDWGNVLGAGIRGAAPIPTSGGILARGAGGGLMQGTAAVAGRAAEEGRAPTPQEAVTEFGIAGTLGVGAGTAGAIAERARKAVSGAPLERAQKFAEAGIEPTIGQLFPSLAATEQRLAVRVPAGPITERLQQQSRQIGKALRGLAPGATEGVKELQDLGTDMIEVLGARGGADYNKSVQMLTQAQEALQTAQTAAQKAVAEEAVGRMTTRIQAQLEEYGTRLMRQAATEVVGGLEPAARMTEVAGGKFLSDYGQGLKRSFNELKSELYKNVAAVQDNPVFNVSDLKIQAKREMLRLAKSTKDQSELFAQELMPALDYVTKLPDTVSLQQLRDAREFIFELSDAAGAYRSRAQGKLSQLSKGFSEVVKDQAVEKLGQQVGGELLYADEVFRQIRPKFSNYGVASLFLGDEFKRGTVGKAAVNDILASGAQSEVWSNIKSLVDDLQSYGAKNVPSLDDVKTIIREQIAGRAYDGNLKTLNVPKLANMIGQIEGASPGFARELGLGNADQFALLNAIKDAFPDATKVPADTFADLLSRSDPKAALADFEKVLASTGKRIMDVGVEARGKPVVEAAAAAGVQGLDTELGRYVARMSAVSAAEDAAALRKIGLPKEAEQKLASAVDYAKMAGQKMQAVQEQARARRANPILAALDLVDDGIPVSADDGQKFFKEISTKPVSFIEKFQGWLADQSAKGNKEAGDLLQNWRQRAMEDLLISSTKMDARGEFLDARAIAASFAESDLRVPDSFASRFKAQIGKKAFDEFKTRILPALRLVGESQQEAAQAGATVRGRGPEQAIEEIGKAGQSLATGQPVSALGKVLNAAMNLGYTQLAARIFSDAPDQARLLRIINEFRKIERGSTAIRPAMIEGQILRAFEDEE